MTKNISLFLLLVFSTLSFCQHKIQSGEYENGLRISYDGESKKITGYYENYTGFDENSKTPRFSCIFYIEGTVVGQKAIIKTYFPENKNEDTIEGELEIGQIAGLIHEVKSVEEIISEIIADFNTAKDQLKNPLF